jgi:hypothetical protein
MKNYLIANNRKRKYSNFKFLKYPIVKIHKVIPRKISSYISEIPVSLDKLQEFVKSDYNKDVASKYGFNKDPYS